MKIYVPAFVIESNCGLHQVRYFCAFTDYKTAEKNARNSSKLFSDKTQKCKYEIIAMDLIDVEARKKVKE